MKNKEQEEVIPGLHKLRRDVKEMLEDIIESMAMSVTVNQVILAIFEEEDGELERRKLVNFFIRRVPEPHLINIVFRVVHTAWMLFPHGRLGGRAPVEFTTIEED